MENEKNHFIAFRATDKEYARIQHKCELAHYNNMSEYLRHAAVHSIIVVYPEDEWKAIRRVIGGAASNINQIAARYNSTGKLYSEDLQDITQSVEKMNQTLCDLLCKLSQIR